MLNSPFIAIVLTLASLTACAYAPWLATLLILLLARIADPEPMERILSAMSLLAPAAALAVLGRYDQILNLPLAQACGFIFFHLGWWQKTQPFRLNLIESILIAATSLIWVDVLLVILFRFPEPYRMAAVIASFALIGFGAYRIRQSAAGRLLRTT